MLFSDGERHLGSLPAFVINLDKSTHRWDLVASSIAPFVAYVHRVSGVDKETLIDSEIERFRRAALANPNLSMRHDKTAIFWRSSMAVWLAHLSALDAAIRFGAAPFLILEDDARFYRQDLAAKTEVPLGGDAYIWGGGLKGSSHTGPARLYASWDGHPNTWHRIDNPVGRHGATALEFRTIDKAIQYAKIIEENPHAYDISWWAAMRELDIRVADYEVIPQCPFLESDRMKNNRTEAQRLLLESVVGTL